MLWNLCLRNITQVSGQKSKGAYQVQLGINGVQTQIEVDTGASLSIMSAETYQMCHPKAKPVLKKSTAFLKTYTGETIFPEGEIDVMLPAHFHGVTDDVVTMLGNIVASCYALFPLVVLVSYSCFVR